MVGFGINLFAYVAVTGLLTSLWVLSGQGTIDDIRAVVQDPSVAREVGFWPAWVIVTWAAALIAHLGIVLSLSTFGRRARRRRAALAKQAVQVASQLHQKAVSPSATPPAGPRRQWVAVMFTDVVNSTRLTEDLGDEEWARVLGRHREFVRSCFRSSGGTEVGTQGDGCLARFASPADAVTCAIEIQRQLRDVTEDAGDFPLEVRIGVHAGDAVDDGEGDIIGRVVNLAARVTSEAEPGEILVTEPVADHVDKDVKLEDRGLVMMRGIAQPRHLLAVSWD
jgi:class 3 adenylate cyclase